MTHKYYVWCSGCKRRIVYEQDTLSHIHRCDKCGRLLKDQPEREYTEQMLQEDAQKGNVVEDISIRHRQQNSDMTFQLRGEDAMNKQIVIDILSQNGEFFSIGRWDQLSLSSPYISKRHATIQVIRGEETEIPTIYIWDHSLNGTLVNGVPMIHCERSEIKSHAGRQLKLGDVITLDANGNGAKLVLQQKE